MSRRLTVVLTRTQEDNQEIAPFFEESGIQVISLPMIAIRELQFNAEQFSERRTSTPLVLLTSRRGTEQWLRLRCEDELVKNIEVRGYMIVGKRSEEMIRSAEHDVRVLVVAGSGIELVEKIGGGKGDEEKEERGEGRASSEEVLYPCSTVRRDELLMGLNAIGYRVVELPLYEPILPEESREQFSGVLEEFGGQFVIAFFSPSAVENFFSLWEGDPATLECAAIGRTTAAALEDRGITNLIVPEHPETPSLIQTLKTSF